MFYPPSLDQQGLRRWKVFALNYELPLEFDGQLLGIWREDRRGGWYTDHYVFQTKGGNLIHYERAVRIEWGDRNVRTWATVFSTAAALFSSTLIPPGPFGLTQHIP